MTGEDEVEVGLEAPAAVPAPPTELRFRLLVSAVTDYSIFMLDPEGLVSSWNAGAKLMKGYRPEEIIGRHVSTFYTPEDRAAGRPQHLLERAAADGRVEDEGYRVRKDGSRFWANVVLTALRDDSGTLVGFGKVTRDLTERREAEEHLRASEERFRLLVEQVQDYAIFMLDPTGRVSTWNAGAERIKGYKASEIIGRHFSAFYDPAEVRAGKCEYELTRAATEGRFEDEGYRVRKDGSRLWANVVITALRNPAGELVGFAKVTRDLTERKAAEEERMRLGRANEAIRLRDEFLAIASHELKTPLTALELQLQSLRERIDQMDENIARKIERATRSSGRLARLVESLLDVSRIATGSFSLSLESLELAEVVESQLDAMRMPAQLAGSAITFTAEERLHGRWDRVRLEQVLTNLMSNALKYGAGKPVAVTLARAGDDAVLTVRDHGAGIPEGDLARIFGRFERASSLSHYGGLGLGLYVTEQIVHAHGGRITAHNMPDGGACFEVALPLAKEATERPAPPLH